MRLLLKILPIIIATTILAGCRSGKNTAPGAGNNTGLQGFEAIEASYADWQRLRVPVTVNLISPRQMSINGVATMVRDSSINISLRMFGMEVGVIDINPDSVTAAIKVNRQYTSFPIANATARYGFTTANIQDLLTGRVFLLGAGDLTPAMAADFKVVRPEEVEKGQWILMPVRQPMQARYAFSINADNTLSALSVTPDGLKPVSIPYTGSATTAAGVFASGATVAFTSKGNKVTAALSWDWDRAIFDSELSPRSFTLDPGYKRFDANQLMKQLP